MKIDLHVHTIERSPCAIVSEENQLKAAIRAGFNGIAITDHNMLVPRDHLKDLNDRYAPFKIFTGIEIDADDLHWVVLGIHDPALESRGWHYPDLLDFAHSRDGFIFLAHPFRSKPDLQVDLDAYPPDGIEIESINTPVNRQADIRALAERLGLVLMRNSDAHRPGGMGTYSNQLPRPAGNDQELVEVLLSMKSRTKAGVIQGE